jgi:hypothetical protein
MRGTWKPDSNYSQDDTILAKCRGLAKPTVSDLARSCSSTGRRSSKKSEDLSTKRRGTPQEAMLSRPSRDRAREVTHKHALKPGRPDGRIRKMKAPCDGKTSTSLSQCMIVSSNTPRGQISKEPAIGSETTKPSRLRQPRTTRRWPVSRCRKWGHAKGHYSRQDAARLS